MLIWLLVGFITELLIGLILPRGDYYNSSSVRLNWAFVILAAPVVLLGVGFWLNIPVLMSIGLGAGIAGLPVFVGYMLG